MTDAASKATVGLHLRVELGMPGLATDDRWSRRADALAAWLSNEFKRERTPPGTPESTPAHLDPAACAATPRQDDNGETSAR